MTNTGDRAGDEVVQLYVRHRTASVPCPVKELRGFKRISMRPGERKTVTFTLFTHQLGFCDERMRFVVQPGTIEVMVGSSSEHLPIAGTFEIAGQATDVSQDKTFFSKVNVE